MLRIEDLDGPRIKAAAARQAIVDLQWLGIDWDEGPVYQSQRLPLYADAITKLIQTGDAYPCVCTRSEVEAAASAPHADDGAAVYPGTCRGRFDSIQQAAEFAGRAPAIRLRVPDRTICWTDAFAGPQRCEIARELGDFVIAKGDGTPAYQLSVVVDDLAAGVTHVVRGDDLLDSSPRQMLIYEMLGSAERVPVYYHLPLVVGPDGRRLAKRHGDSRLSFYRDRGVPPSDIVRLLARWCGIPANGDMHPSALLLDRFDINRLPRERIVFGPAKELTGMYCSPGQDYNDHC